MEGPTPALGCKMDLEVQGRVAGGKEQVRRGHALAWQRSVPLAERVFGVDTNVLEQIGEEYPELVLRWDPSFETVGIFKEPVLGGHPVFQDHSPFGPEVDLRLLVALRGGDIQRYGAPGRAFDAWHEQVDQRKAAAVKEQKTAARRKADPEMAATLALRTITAATGKKYGIRVVVPELPFGKGAKP